MDRVFQHGTPVQGTGLAQWETTGPGPCPCIGPV